MMIHCRKEERCYRVYLLTAEVTGNGLPLAPHSASPDVSLHCWMTGRETVPAVEVEDQHVWTSRNIFFSVRLYLRHGFYTIQVLRSITQSSINHPQARYLNPLRPLLDDKHRISANPQTRHGTQIKFWLKRTCCRQTGYNILDEYSHQSPNARLLNPKPTLLDQTTRSYTEDFFVPESRRCRSRVRESSPSSFSA